MNEAETVHTPLLLTVVEAARLLAVGRTTVYALIARGELRTIHIGRARRIPIAAVFAYVAALEEPIPNDTPSSYAPRRMSVASGAVDGIG
jgi:excisionase family DNA binding protein